MVGGTESRQRVIPSSRETEPVAYRVLTWLKWQRVPNEGSHCKLLILNGGARRNRTDDLFNAIEALSQLSYGPVLPMSRRLRWGRSSLALRARRYSRKTCAATRPAREKSGRRRLALHLRRRRGLTSPGRAQPSSSGAMSPSMRLLTSSSSSSSSSRNGSSGASSAIVLDFDVVDRGLDGLLLAGLDFVERHDVDAGRGGEVALLLVGLRGGPGARRRALKHGPAFRADDGILVEIKEFGAAILALMLGSEFGFGHCDRFPVVEGGVRRAPVSRRSLLCQCDFSMVDRFKCR